MDQGKEVVVEISSRSSLLIPLLFHAHFGGRIYPIILTIFVLLLLGLIKGTHAADLVEMEQT